MKSIALIIAMQSEAQPIIDAMALTRQQPPFHTALPFLFFSGTVNQYQLNLLISGSDPHLQVDNVATVPAALMAYLAVEKFSPAFVVNAGTAGGIGGKGCEIGDVYLSSGHFSFHDRRIPIPGFQEYGRGRYPAFDAGSVANTLGLKTGAISSGNSLDMVTEDFQEIQESGAIIKDMEAAAIAWVCRTLHVPLIAVKAITDLIDTPAPTEEQFLQNLSSAVHNLGKKTPEVIRLLTTMRL